MGSRATRSTSLAAKVVTLANIRSEQMKIYRNLPSAFAR
jgi:hypothetical protein